MFRPHDVIIGLALKHFKNNTQITLTGNGISFVTQYIHNFYRNYEYNFYRNYEYIDDLCFGLLTFIRD
jgi:hypothetical protein